MYGVLPYGSSIDRITIKGIFLRKTLEISAGKFSPDGENEGVGFPQVSNDHYYIIYYLLQGSQKYWAFWSKSVKKMAVGASDLSITNQYRYLIELF